MEMVYRRKWFIEGNGFENGLIGFRGGGRQGSNENWIDKTRSPPLALNKTKKD